MQSKAKPTINGQTNYMWPVTRHATTTIKQQSTIQPYMLQNTP